ncbi:fatty-acyl-CoA synthase [Rhizobiales bacterium GAS188]|nr:fatty-acyl-CoA synthase [Rhizobiales bacterium GAS188]
MRAETLSSILARNVAQRPRAPAATDEGGSLDWQQLAALSEGYAALLSRQGVRASDRVALWLPNCVDYLALIFACARLGALAVHVNTRFRTAEVGYLLRRSRASVLVTAYGFGPVDFPALLAEIAAEDRNALRCVIARKAAAREVAGLPVVALEPSGRIDGVASPEAPCLTFTTSGTTSGPKLVLHSQRSIAGHASDVAAALATGKAGSCLLSAVPLCGTFGLSLAMGSAAGGAHIVLMDQFDGAEAEALIRRHAVTHTGGSDDMLGRIAKAAAGRPFDTLVFTGFASFTPTAAAAVAAAEALGMKPRGLYGSSEVQALFAIAPESRRTMDGGVPVSPAAEISVRDPESGDPVPDDQDGELCLRAPSFFSGYLDDAAATARAFTADGFFKTGDLARHVPPGFVFKSRIGDSLRLGGFLVNPEEIEGFLQSLPGVAEAQVVAAENGRDRVAFAFIRAAPNANPQESAILAACRKSLARYKQPARVVALDAFPVTESPNGVKIQRVKLREMADLILRSAR